VLIGNGKSGFWGGNIGSFLGLAMSLLHGICPRARSDSFALREKCNASTKA
jgi:hypothetical protein